MTSHVQYDLFDPVATEPAIVTPDLGLRPYQQAAREAVAKVHERSRGALVVLATGMGKTRTFGAIAWDHKLRGSKVLVLCPTIVLCQQMYEDLRKLGLSVGLEQASNRIARPLPDVVVASVATMRGDRLKAFKPDDFGLVCSDEAHRSTSAAQRAIYAHFTGAKRLGLTATPDRTDGVSLANVFDEVAYDMPMLAGIEQGYLAPLKFVMADTDFDPSRIRTVAGEVDPGSVADELVRSGCLHQAANTLAELAPTKRTVAFLPTVAASKAFVSELNARNTRPDGHVQHAVHIDASTPEGMREQVFQDFRDGKCQVISNVGLLIEGWDGPWTECIALLNPTKSRSRVAQMIGRGTRNSSGKTDCLVVDFCHGRLKKGRLASPADALAGKMLPDDVHEQLAKEGDIAEEVKRAEVKALELEALKAKREAIAAERAARRDQRKDLVKKQRFVFGVAELDMHALFGTTRSDKLLELLSQHGVDIPKAEEDRRRQNLCSLKQANLLAKFGMDPNLSRRLASEAIQLLADNKWRMSDALRARKAFWPVQ